MQTIRVKFRERVEKIISEILLRFIGLGTYPQDYLTKVEGSSIKLSRLETRINNLCYTSMKPKPK